MMKGIVFAAALLLGIGSASTASAQLPHRLQRFNEVARPSPETVRMERMHSRPHATPQTSWSTTRTSPMPRQLDAWRNKAQTWDDNTRTTRPQRVRVVDQQDRSRQRDRRAEMLLTRKLKERARCELDDCSSGPRRVVKSDANRSNARSWKNAKPYEAIRRPKTNTEKTVVDPRVKARFQKLERMLMPTSGDACREPTQCLI